ncbi:hypothetical protein ONE63_008686 [Megalurothrips usitatus]|uniref:NECAP PHear domain-containing protein n=1 Tax=Megalurothrips usitatus TaxID=439358 RepID=A0AAV7XLY1_9NEOP|nr:hypothetical protein ONE63_008686 [Megalurothrips usitatus]
MADGETYESVLLVKSEVFVYKIPPRATNRGYRATDWNLDAPQWTGRMRLVAKGNDCVMKLEDKASGELFAKSPIDKYPGIAIEAVSDSSRYFVIRIQDDDGRAAFIGLGFSDRSDSFDLNVALQDHFKWIKKSEEIEKEKDDDVPKADFRFKEGETIKINMKITKKDGSEATVKPKARPSGMGGILPPPPGGVGKIAPPPKVTPTSSPSHVASNPVPGMDLLNLGGPSATASATSPAGASPAAGGLESWGDFTTANPNAPAQASPSNPNWVQF